MVSTFRKIEAGPGPASALSLTSLALVISLTGCGLLEDRSERYVNAPEAEPLEIPAGMEGQNIGQSMAIRDLEENEQGRMYPSDIPRPPDMTADILEQNYVIEELDGRVWLLVNDVPPALWPSVAAYMNERGLGVAHDSPQLGLLQSEVVNFSKKARDLLQLPDEPDRSEPRLVVQARVAPGVRRKTTEISLRPVEVEEDPDQLLSWSDRQAAAEQTETRKRLLEDLSVFLQGREDNRSYSRAALGMTIEPLVRLESENDTPVAIEMDLDYGRAWAELRRTLDDAGIEVLDLDRSAGYVQVDYRTESELSGGWFSWFRDEPEARHTATINLEQSGEKVRVTTVKAEDWEGQDRSRELLSELFEYLY